MANEAKLSDVFQKVITERTSDRLERTSFALVDSGGSGYRQGIKYLDITDSPEKLFETLIRNSGRGS